MTALLIATLRVYLLTLTRVAPRAAGRQAFRLFSTPRRRAAVPRAMEPVMARARRFDVEVDGGRVAAYHWAREERSPRALLAHGWESRAARLAVWVEPFLEAGFEVVAFDAPAHGESEGRRATPADFAASIRSIAVQVGGVDVCVGHSLGGFAALLAAGGGHLLGEPGMAVERLLLIAGAESAVDAMRMFCEILGLGEPFLPRLLEGATEAAGRPVTDFDAHRWFVDHRVPTLWLHDPADDEVPFAAAERVARVCPHVTLERIDGLGHHDIARDPEIIRRGLSFLRADRPAQRG